MWRRVVRANGTGQKESVPFALISKTARVRIFCYANNNFCSSLSAVVDTTMYIIHKLSHCRYNFMNVCRWFTSTKGVQREQVGVKQHSNRQ
jgi:hypothetical protein